MLSLVGCRDVPDHPETYPVTGVVTQGGKPVAGVDVQFIPVDTKGETRTARGTTDEAGKYELYTFFSAAADVEGAVPGEYKVTLFKQKTAGGPAGHDPNWRPGSRDAYMASMKVASELPEQYAKQETTPLKASVKDDDQKIDFKAD
jgi:hypothetical protein